MKKKIILICPECYSRNYKIVLKDETNIKEIKKYCPKCNKHTLHKKTR